MGTARLYERQKIAEEVAGKLQEKVSQRVAESDEKNARLPNETRAIIRVVNSLLLWLCEGYPDEILWFYQYGSIPCRQRVGIFDRDVKTLIVLLKDRNKAALAADVENRWQNIIQTASATDKKLSGLRELYNHDEDNPAYANDVKSALYDIKTYTEQLADVLFEVAKQQSSVALGMLQQNEKQEQGGLSAETQKLQDNISNLTKAERLAYQSYEYAIDKNPPLAGCPDRKVYQWVKEHGIPGEEKYDLPSIDTWKRYVRAGRKANNTQKNTPRTGRKTNTPQASKNPELLNQISNKFAKAD